MPTDAEPEYACSHCAETSPDPTCGNCDQCNGCCECYHCASCCEAVNPGDYCGDCDQCSCCCECLYCPSCGDRTHDGHEAFDYCGDCEHCYSCCECERCEDCGDRTDECCCEASGVLCYSACPLRRLDYDRSHRSHTMVTTKFGLEVEMSHWSLEQQDLANNVYEWLRLKFGSELPRSNGYQITSSDASIVGSSPGEVKTIPLTVREHSLVHYTLLVGQHYGDVKQFTGSSPGKQAQLMANAFANNGPSLRWMRGAKAWDNDSCGMHINLEWHVAESGTWAKVIHWLVRCGGGMHAQLGGRSPSCYCFTHSERGKAKPKNYLGNTKLARSRAWNEVAQRYSNAKMENGEYHNGFPFQDYVLQKHSAISHRHWGGYELRLFRSSTNPLRILGNCEMINVILHHFSSVPWHAVCDDQGNPLVSLTDISRTAYELRHRYPYAAALCRRVNNQLSLAFAS